MSEVRVGTIKYENGKKIYPKYKDFIRIEVMTPSTPYGSLGPYSLSKGDMLMENIWQCSKIFKSVPDIIVPYSRFDRTTVWKWNAEDHLNDDNEILPNYWIWRNTLAHNKYAVRHPVGLRNKRTCVTCIYNEEDTFTTELNDFECLGYIEARKRLYLPEYTSLVKREHLYKKLEKYIKDGKNLLILEVDGPIQESLQYYKEEYGVNDDFIVDGTIEANEKNMKIMINDRKHIFGHGYCLATALLDLDIC